MIRQRRNTFSLACCCFVASTCSCSLERSCGFKVGRITFNTSLAWFSFFFGLTGLLYHFVQN
ncbi:hypothetical protein pdam_00019139 [Pocillopora damicornis]|uniref:Uncharacterized protein n=1 Tax=Pocillopora damicornis TaxID=46731 RepID=A0A3M6TTI9_POCDA|nr:hypothetical protein pdam_00019139 [Pocillopora damicornis]